MSPEQFEAFKADGVPEDRMRLVGRIPAASSPSGKAPGFGPGTAGSNPAEASNSKRGPGRPKTITDMKAYKAEKARQYRARLKAEREAK